MSSVDTIKPTHETWNGREGTQIRAIVSSIARDSAVFSERHAKVPAIGYVILPGAPAKKKGRASRPFFVSAFTIFAAEPRGME